MTGVLSGLKVLEMAAIGPVPFAGTMLADMGAEVIRVDRIPSSPDVATSTYSTYDHRGRRSIAVDLKHKSGIETVLRLIDDADMLLEGFRPGVMEKLGLGPDVCLARNAQLVYGRMTGWGQEGPLSKAAGHDLNYIALTGALHAMGSPDRPPSPPLNLVGDYGGGAMMLLVGVLAALWERERSNRGQVIDAAMTDGAIALLAPFYAQMAQGVWQDRRGANLLDGGAPFYGVFECADGRFVSIGSLEPQFYQLLLKKCGLESDADFGQQMDRSSWPRMRQRLESLFRTRSREQWCELIEGSDVCFAPVLSLKEAAQHPHNRARNAFIDADGGPQPAPAPRFGRTPSSASTAVALEGQDSISVLKGAGFSEEEIDRLAAEGVVYARP